VPWNIHTGGPGILLTLWIRSDRLELTLDSSVRTSDNLDCCNAQPQTVDMQSDACPGFCRQDNIYFSHPSYSTLFFAFFSRPLFLPQWR